MDEHRVELEQLRQGKRLSDGRVLITTHGADGRVAHAIVYDEAVEHVLEELHGDAADAAYGSRSRAELGPIDAESPDASA